MMNPSDAELEKSFPMGENTNSKIGGMEDWQHVGGGKAFPEPPMGPVQRTMQNAKFEVRSGGEGPDIKLPPINAKSTGGVVGKPVYGYGPDLASTKSADVRNTSTNINQSASGENLSAKFKNPQVKQDVGEKGRNQYED